MNIKITKINKEKIPKTTRYMFGTVANDKLCEVSKGDYDIYFDIDNDTYMVNLSVIANYIIKNKANIVRLNKINNLLK